MKKLNIDYSVYLVTDRNLSLGRSTYEVVEKAIAGGVTIVQLREKDISTREFLAEGKKIKMLLADANIPFLINDRTDVAFALDADGVHLGQDDMSVEIARKILGNEKIIGVSVRTPEEAKEAEAKGANYVAVSAVFPTPTKTDTGEPVGIDGVARIRSVVSLPLVAIGGIKKENARMVVEAGADGVAVVSAIVSAVDPRMAALELSREVHSGKTLRTSK